MVEHGVYNRVERAVAVTQPEEHLKHRCGDVAGAAQGGERVCEEKGEPAEDKHSHDHGQDKGEAPLSVLPAFPAGCSGTGLHVRPRWSLSGLRLGHFGRPHPPLLHQGTKDGLVPVGRRRLFLHVQLVDLSLSRFSLFLFRVATLSLPRARRLPRSLLGDLIDSDIHRDDDDAGCEERGDAGEYDVPALLVDLAHVRVVLFHGDERGEGNDGGQHPNDEDGAFNPAWRPPQVVLDGLGDGPVSVQADGAQVDDGRGAEEHVQRQVDLAPHFAKVPGAHQLLGQGERHHRGGDQDVCTCQRDQKQVLRRPQGSAGGDGDDDHDVAEHGHEDEDGHQGGQRHRGLQCVRVRRRSLRARQGPVGGTTHRVDCSVSASG